jgi:hypothetical protein
MYKKLMATALLVCSLPVMANAAWQLNTWAKSAGGQIDSQNMTNQRSVAGSIFKTYTTTTGTQAITVTADTGYTISSVILDGHTTNTSGTYQINEGSGDKSLFATFKPNTVAVTAGVGAGGSVTPTSIKSIYYNTKVATPIIFRFIPKAGYKVDTINGATGFTVSSALPAAVGTAVTVTIPVNTVITTPIALSGTFTTSAAIANAGPSKTVVAGPVTLTGSAQNGIFSKWSSVSVPVGAAIVPTTSTADLTFTAVPGDYQFKYRVANTGAQSWATMNLHVVSSWPAAANQCIPCHNSNEIGGAGNAAVVQANWSSSSYKTSGVWCASCHTGADNGGHPGTLANVNPNHKAKGLACSMCHSGALVKNGDAHMVNDIPVDVASGKCAHCHTGAALPAAGHHFGSNTAGSDDRVGCIDCHSVGQNAGAGFVNDNSGVRAVTGEFGKWSHHVTGVTLQNAHCAACHLEGKASNVAGANGQNGQILVDTAYHMIDNKTHLRHADTNAEILWDPAAPNFSNMDNFCMSCHDSDGATGIADIQALMVAAPGKTANAANPFGDTISNQYDQLERPAVVDAKGQFNTSNPSHHAVSGKKYNARTRGDGIVPGTITSAAFAANSSAAMPGKRSTIFDAGKFNPTYVTLGNASPEIGARNGGSALGDDSTLHCGDCHTVGQYREADKNVLPFNKAVIGAHGSNNEYMLRNNIGTDEKHIGRATDVTGLINDFSNTKPYLVCFNCHLDTAYDKDGNGTAHGGERTATQTACNFPQNTNSGRTGEARLGSYWSIPGNATYDGKLAIEAAPGTAGKETVTFSNYQGIQCANCHNSGVSADSIFGGIHGSKNQTYTDGMGNTTKSRRFFPGLGNTMFVPGTKGGFTGGSQAQYTNYSGNRNGTTAASTTPSVGASNKKCGYDGKQPCTTQADVDAWVAMDQFKKKGQTNQTFTAMPVRNDPYALPATPPAAGPPVLLVNPIAPSYNYTTGGVSDDLNWEQWKQQSVAGQADPVANAMGCYTLSPTGTYKVSNLASAGYPADDKRLAATDGQKGPDGRELFDNWGGCDDHNGAAGKGTGPTRNVLRPVSY